MSKKVFSLMVVMAMMLGIFWLTACNNISLDDYKAEAEVAIQAHADTKIAGNGYTQAGLNAIEQAVTDGKEAIKNATTRASVTAERDKAIRAIDDIPQLTTELESKIKADYLQEFGHELLFGDELQNKFYGLYDGAAVFFIAGVDAAFKTVFISGVKFSYNSSWTILVWKDGVFYDLEQIESIFNAGILTQGDLEQIGIAHDMAHTREDEMIDIPFPMSFEDYSNEFFEKFALC